MSKARDLADLLSVGGILNDGVISVSEIENVTADATELNKLDGVTATTEELNHVDGVTSNIQTQMDTKAALAGPTFTGTVTAPTINASTGLQIGGVAITSTAAELNNVTGINTNVQAQLDTKKEEFTPVVVTSNTTAVADRRYFFSAASITLTLPASPSAGDTVAITEIAGNTDNVVGRNGSNIMSLEEDMTIDSAYAAFQLQYVDATIGWAVAQ